MCRIIVKTYSILFDSLRLLDRLTRPGPHPLPALMQLFTHSPIIAYQYPPPPANYGRVRVCLPRTPADLTWQTLHRPPRAPGPKDYPNTAKHYPDIRVIIRVYLACLADRDNPADLADLTA